MKSDFILRFFSIFLVLIIPISAEGAKVTRIVNRPAKSQNASLPVENVITKVETSEQIEAVLKQIQAQDIKYYRYLKSIQTKYFDQFLAALNKWVNELTPGKLEQEKKSLMQKQKSFRLEMEKTARLYKTETDDIKKKQIKAQLIKVVEDFFHLDIEWDQLMIKLKRQEIAFEETQCEIKQGNKADFFNKTYARLKLNAEDFK
jgi:hypothetical protein